MCNISLIQAKVSTMGTEKNSILCIQENVRVHRSTCLQNGRAHVQGWHVRRPFQFLRYQGAVLLGLDWLKVLATSLVNLVVPCLSSHRMKLSCGVWNEPLVPYIRKGRCSPPWLIVSVPVEEFGSFNKLWGVPISSSCSAKVPDVPHGVNGGVTFVENNEEWGGGDTLCKSLAVQILLCVESHPVLQLSGDVLVLPLSDVGDDDTRVEGACVGPHPQFLNSLLFEV